MCVRVCRSCIAVVTHFSPTYLLYCILFVFVLQARRCYRECSQRALSRRRCLLLLLLTHSLLSPEWLGGACNRGCGWSYPQSLNLNPKQGVWMELSTGPPAPVCCKSVECWRNSDLECAARQGRQS